MSSKIKNELTEGFLKERQDIITKKTLKYQWEALSGNNVGGESSYAIRNLEICAGVKKGVYTGFVFQDSDLAKWIEASSYYLESNEDKLLEDRIDYIIDLIEKTQMDDGYFNTYYQSKDISLRFTNLEKNHELYCLGHLIEGAVAYFNATGKKKLLDIACKYSDLVYELFGEGNTKIKGYPGHQEIELALVKLFEVTNSKKYLELARYFIFQRGTSPNYFIEEAQKNIDIPAELSLHSELPKNDIEQIKRLMYSQSHIPVTEETNAVGHAVRAMYMYCAMADLAKHENHHELWAVCKKLWENVVDKKMYVTGGIGSNSIGERFTIDFDLPNDTAYAETCASIGLFLWAYRMFRMEQKSKYVDIMERTLYNGILSGVSLDGTKYFYTNPLEVWPEACENRDDLEHIKTERQGWFGCCCCPTNISRLMTSISKYIYCNINKTLYVNLYASSKCEINDTQENIRIEQKTQFPWDGRISFNIVTSIEYTIAFRIPYWADRFSVMINGETTNAYENNNGYIYITKKWNDQRDIVINLPIKRIYPNHNIRKDAGKISLQKGAIIYCLEEVDNGKILNGLYLDEESQIVSEFEDDLLGGIVTLQGKAKRIISKSLKSYSYDEPCVIDHAFKAVPYYAWGNRGVGEMLVWIRQQ